MLRVAEEVRIFPVVDVNAVRSLYVDGIIDYYENRGYCIEEIPVHYEIQIGENTMLRIGE